MSFRTVADLDAALADDLLRWGLSLADSKQRFGQRLSEWVNGAPALEAAVGSSAMTQDELGHARSLFAMLRDFPAAPVELGTESDLEDRSAYFNPRALDAPWRSWLDVIATNVLFDRALMFVFESLRDSTFAPLNQRAGKVLQEERYHRIFGDSWLTQLAAREDLRADLQAALARAADLTVEWFGPPEGSAEAGLHAAGVLPETMDSIRSRWRAAARPLLAQKKFELQIAARDWSKWNPARRELAHRA